MFELINQPNRNKLAEREIRLSIFFILMLLVFFYFLIFHRSFVRINLWKKSCISEFLLIVNFLENYFKEFQRILKILN